MARYQDYETLCKAHEKKAIRKEWSYMMQRLHAHETPTDTNHCYDSYILPTVSGVLRLRLFHKLKPDGIGARIDPRDFPWIGGMFMDLGAAKANLTLQRGFRFNKHTGKYNFMNVTHTGLPQIEKELAELLKPGTNNVL